jgi:hypothetical protein
MKTFLKILAALALLVIIWHFAPVVIVPFVVLAFVSLILGAVLGALGVALLVALLAVAIGLIAALSPLWIPALCICGFIWLIKSLTAKPAAPPPAMPA